MSKNKFLLPIILLLLVLTLPLGIYGLLTPKEDEYADVDNPNHLHLYNGYLYYYDTNGELTYKYECKSDNCSDVTAEIDDKYLDNFTGDTSEISFINDDYVLIYEDGTIKLLSLLNGEVLRTFKQVINYGYPRPDYLIIQNENGKYSAISTSTLEFVIPEDYSYVGYLNTDKTLGKFSVEKNDKHYIIDSSNTENKLSSEYNNPIVYYTDEFIITKSNNSYYFYDYNGGRIGDAFNKYDVYNNIIIAKPNDESVVVFYRLSNVVTYSEDNIEYDYTIGTDGIIILEDGVELEVIN